MEGPPRLSGVVWPRWQFWVISACMRMGQGGKEWDGCGKLGLGAEGREKGRGSHRHCDKRLIRKWGTREGKQLRCQSGWLSAPFLSQVCLEGAREKVTVSRNSLQSSAKGLPLQASHVLPVLRCLALTLFSDFRAHLTTPGMADWNCWVYGLNCIRKKFVKSCVWKWGL
jgi:hypothetical protein